VTLYIKKSRKRIIKEGDNNEEEDEDRVFLIFLF